MKTVRQTIGTVRHLFFHYCFLFALPSYLYLIYQRKHANLYLS